jgi:SPX domain protein involved in polyphosphate accumulation
VSSGVRWDTSKGERFEFKYRLDVATYHRLRCSLAGFTRHDPHCRKHRNRRYLVRSLYFDTYDYAAYEEKQTGVPARIKIRVRTYWADPDKAEFLRLELKTKRANLINKFSERVQVSDHEHFMTTRCWPGRLGSVADEFRRLALLKNLQPKVLVDYDREALVPVDGSKVKITFDHNMRFAEARDLFPRHLVLHASRPRWVVMEVKAQADRPKWLERLIRTYELPSVPNSKFAFGIERTQHAICLR